MSTSLGTRYDGVEDGMPLLACMGWCVPKADGSVYGVAPANIMAACICNAAFAHQLATQLPASSAQAPPTTGATP
jgi:hypothetical protein